MVFHTLLLEPYPLSVIRASVIYTLLSRSSDADAASPKNAHPFLFFGGGGGSVRLLLSLAKPLSLRRLSPRRSRFLIRRIWIIPRPTKREDSNEAKSLRPRKSLKSESHFSDGFCLTKLNQCIHSPSCNAAPTFAISMSRYNSNFQLVRW